MNHRLLALSFAFAPLAGCVVTTEDPMDMEEEASEIQSHIEDELLGEIDAMLPTDGSPPSESQLASLETYLCRRGNLSSGIFSLRSFNGHLCQADYIDGLDLVGGAALLICWEGDHEDFQDSSCAENALDEYGLETYDRDAIISQMRLRIEAYISRSSAGPAYAAARELFCRVPSSLLGPAAELHDLWCGG
ncbi:MAG: hypothetical protein H6722_02160 [Sandaracinus sp.]|nr:hypothetical protein [Sandaracinus sp.]